MDLQPTARVTIGKKYSFVREKPHPRNHVSTWAFAASKPYIATAAGPGIHEGESMNVPPSNRGASRRTSAGASQDALSRSALTPRASVVENGRWCGPLFIVGMPRSGTKLLRGLLAQHARIRIPDIETDFFPFLVRWVRENGEPSSEPAFERLREALHNATYFTYRERREPPFSWDAWYRECAGRYDPAGLFEGFIRSETETARTSNVIWGDKSPAYIRHVALLLEHFPDARIVHIVRDVRDYCLSIHKKWRKDARRAAHDWARDVGSAHRICRANPERCIEVTYESLLHEPTQEMHRLSQFLGVEPLAGDSVRLDRPVEVHGDAAGWIEIKRDNFHKFATALAPHEIRGIEALAFDTMKLLGYEPLYARRQKRLGRLEQWLLRLKDGAWLVACGAPRRGVAATVRFHLSHSRVVRAPNFPPLAPASRAMKTPSSEPQSPSQPQATMSPHHTTIEVP